MQFHCVHFLNYVFPNLSIPTKSHSMFYTVECIFLLCKSYDYIIFSALYAFICNNNLQKETQLNEVSMCVCMHVCVRLEYGY